MAEADDRAAWNFAIENRFVIVSKDGDFRQLSFVAGAPPKVVRVRMGDCSTADIVAALRRRAGDLHLFETTREAALLVIA
jgi:predicted nuclease of predicted toxin-antitoxin system